MSTYTHRQAEKASKMPDFKDTTVDLLKDNLTAHGVEFTSKFKKPDLYLLTLEKNLAIPRILPASSGTTSVKTKSRANLDDVTSARVRDQVDSLTNAIGNLAVGEICSCVVKSTGKRCTNKAKDGTVFCGVHLNAVNARIAKGTAAK
jgi:hypothetical protein